MITKLCIVCLCVTSAAMIGLWYSKRKRGRVKYFDSCVKLTDKLISCVSFRKEKTCEILEEFADSDGSELAGHVKTFCADPYATPEIKSSILKSAEKKELVEFLDSLGDSDSDTQIRELRNRKSRFESLYEEENAKYKKTGSLGLKLSVLIGLAIGILIL